ncbi:hypothetical protein LPUS_02860 [Lasallia pustulata]|uniref:Uncharacterized protein n=1 Tax=Lasallia pustulata TaxID=136370 RepID=A0A1W5CTU9_9LECA|nr:hypothetical protein LPUS_02860 [Lasallia pustulata]
MEEEATPITPGNMTKTDLNNMLQDKNAGKKFKAYIQEYEGNENDENDDESKEQEDNDNAEALALELENTEFMNTSENFTTMVSTIAVDQAQLHHQELLDQSTYHAITQSIPPDAENFMISSWYTLKEFHGIMLDTGAANTSTAGYRQAKAYRKEGMDTQRDLARSLSILVFASVGKDISEYG